MFAMNADPPPMPPPPQEKPRAGRRAAAASAQQEGEEAPPQEPQQQQQQQQEQQEQQPSEDAEGSSHARTHIDPPSGNVAAAKDDEQQPTTPSQATPQPPKIQGRRGAVGGFMAGTFQKRDDEGAEASGEGDPVQDPGEGQNKQLAGVSKRKQEQHVQAQQQKTQAKAKYDDRATDAEILDIPELEEEGKEDLSRVVAEAPKVRNHRVQGINELDEDMQYMLPATNDKDIDLSMLTVVLASSEQVEEKDDVWSPETLLTQLASELNSEIEKTEGMAKEGKDAVAAPMA